MYNEIALKKHMDTSVHLQNFFMYFFGVLFNALGLIFITYVQKKNLTEVFVGQNQFTMLIVVSNAVQGILSSFFFKYADTILKKYSSTVATIFTGVMSMLLFNHPISLNFVIGVSVVFISMHQFFTYSTETLARDESKASSGFQPYETTTALSRDLRYPYGMPSGSDNARLVLLPR